MRADLFNRSEVLRYGGAAFEDAAFDRSRVAWSFVFHSRVTFCLISHYGID